MSLTTRNALIGALFCAIALPAGAQCNVSASSLAFGDYDSLAGLPVTSVGSVTVSCTLALGYNIALSRGGASSFSPRALSSGGNTLSYNVYTSPTYMTVWGDGSSGTATVSGLIGLLLLPKNHVVYGRIPGGQNAAAGNYSDTLSVTVSF